MTRAAAKLPTPRRRFRVGTTGWNAADLDDPHIEAKWAQGRYEIVEGVLTRIPAAYYDSGLALKRLIRIVDTAIAKTDPDGEAVTEVDLIVGPMRVPVVDAIYLSPSDRAAQRSAYAKVPNRRPRMKYGRILVPPTLIIESVSPGHEAHDRVTKRAWYAQMKVPHYWLLTAQERSLECLVLAGPDYRADAAGTENDVVRPSLFPGLVIPLATLWAE
jgi:Uma2 family endonuclease